MSIEYELSPLQRGMLATALASPEAGADITQIVIRSQEPFRLEFVERAWQCLVDEIEALRVAFVWQGRDRPVQHPFDRAALPFAIAADPFDAFLAEDRRRGFDMSVAPLMRVTAFPPRDDGHVFVWTTHHAVIDGRSIVLVLERFQEIYAALTAGCPVPARSWPSGLEFLAERVRRIDRHGARAHWKAALDGLTSSPRLNLWPEPEVAGGVHEEIETRLSAGLTRSLHQLAAATRVTVNNVVQTAWALTLSCFTGEDDVMFGSTRAGRPSTKGDGPELVGNFINTVPVRVRIDPGAPVEQLLHQVRDAWRGSRDWDQVALSDIQAWNGQQTGRPLFETSVGVERHTLEQALSQSDPAWRSRHVTLLGKAPLPLVLLAYLSDRLLLRLEYDTSRFPEEIARNVLSTVAHLLGELVVRASGPVKALGFLPSELRPEQTPADAARSEGTFLDRLKGVVSRHGPLTAVEHRGDRLTYYELWEQGQTIARALHQKGVRRGDAVITVAERGLPLARVIVALQQLGAIYTPAEPRHADTDLSHALRYPKAKAVLSSRALAGRLNAGFLPLWCIEDLVPGDVLTNDLDPPQASSPCYTLFTSGSTGVPKGVEVSHASVAHYVDEMGRLYGVGPGSRWLQLSSLAFDISIEELFVTWGNAGTVVFRPEDGVAGVAQLQHWIESLDLDVVSPPTALWHEWVTGLDTPPSPRLELVVIGGEAASMAAWRKWTATPWGKIRLLNAYGPTETTISVSIFEPPGAVPAEWLARQTRMPIGVAVPGARLLLLDRHGRRVPRGAPGELYIGGPQVALGYASDEAATARAFVDVPVGGGSPVRMFRSGDLAYELPGGDLSFIERKDRQAKIRGFRVDLGRLEALLAEHPGVRQSIFRVIGSERDKRLVAYVIPWEPDLSEWAVASHLRRFVAHYALPDAIVFLEHLPMTSSGKIDLEALPLPAATAIELPEQIGADVEPVRAALLDLVRAHFPWREVGPDDRFFEDLGADSLTAVRLVADVNTHLKCAVPLGALVSYDTVSSLALEVHARRVSGRRGTYLVPLNKRGVRDPLFFVHGGDGHALAFKDLARHLGGERPCFAFDAAALTDAPHPPNIATLASEYARELTAAWPVGPVLLSGYCLGGLIALEMASLLRAEGRDVRFVGLVNCYVPGWPQLRPPARRLRSALQDAHRSGWSRTAVSDLMGRVSHRIKQTLRLARPTEPPLTALEVKLARAQRSYRPRPYDGPVCLFRGTPPRSWEEPDTLGWAGVLPGHLTVFPRIPAHHVDMINEPYAGTLARQLQQALQQIEGTSASER